VDSSLTVIHRRPFYLRRSEIELPRVELLEEELTVDKSRGLALGGLASCGVLTKGFFNDRFIARYALREHNYNYQFSTGRE
jgi:hypothetical protein